MKLFNTSTNTHQLLKSRLLLYADSKNMPNYLKYKFIQSYEHKFHRTYYDEKLIMDTVSGQLKKVILIFLKFLQDFHSFLKLFETLRNFLK